MSKPKGPFVGPLVSASLILGTSKARYDWHKIQKAIPQGKARRVRMGYQTVRAALKKLGAGPKWKVCIRRRKFVYLVHLR